MMLALSPTSFTILSLPYLLQENKMSGKSISLRKEILSLAKPVFINYDEI